MGQFRHRRATGAMALVAAAATGLTVASTAPASGQPQAAAKATRFDVQLLSFNDFHGNLEPPSGSSGVSVVDHRISATTGLPEDVTVPTGGVEYLATHLKQARLGHPKTLTVAAGDIVGASPLLSAAFHDEPTIEAMNLLGLNATAVGNHEFDEGYKELQRLSRGGCIDDGPDGANNQNSCPDGTFAGARFPILAANVKVTRTGRTILKPYTIKDLGDGVKIAFIGMTLKDTPNIVTASGVAGLTFQDEVQTANALVPKIKARGVNAIVVLLHQGDVPSLETWTNPATGQTYQVNPSYDAACGGGSGLNGGPLTAIAQNLSPEIDMLITGHTHQPYVCNIPDPAGRPRLVTSASSFGRLYTETNLKYDTRTKDIVRASVSGTNMLVDRYGVKDASQTSLISKYKTLVSPLANRELGAITTDINRAPNAGGENPLGDLIADAQLSDDSVVTGGKVPTIAFMNPGGIRADLVFAPSGAEAPGVVTYGEAFTVQPFNNFLVSLDLTGAQIKTLLTQQWTGLNATTNKILQVSEGFAYSSTGTGAGRTLGKVTLGGSPLVDTATYRIVTNNFLADGGDGFAAFTGGTGKYFGGLDIDAFADYLAANSPYAPTPLDRISYTP